MNPPAPPAPPASAASVPALADGAPSASPPAGGLGGWWLWGGVALGFTLLTVAWVGLFVVACEAKVESVPLAPAVQPLAAEAGAGGSGPDGGGGGEAR